VNARDDRLDLLKAIGLSFVFVWHLHPLYVDNAPAVDALVRFFDFEISLTAVPTFLSVSFVLFYPRAASGLGRRLWRLFQIYAFWTAVQTLLALAAARGQLRPSWEWLALGGPELPSVGGSVFYYLFDLMILTALAAGFARLDEAARRVLAWVIVLASLAHFEWARYQGHTLLYWRPDNFILYIPTAYYLPRLVRYRSAFLVAWAAAAARDMWQDNAAQSVYGRATVFFGALALAGFVLSRPVRAGTITRLLALYSLGLYAVHKYWQWACIAAKNGHALNLHIGAATVHLNAVWIFAVTIALSAATVALLARTPLRRFVA
jgi:hypothetical protein